MIVRIIVVVCNQLVIISIGLDGLSKRVADIQCVGPECRYQCAGVDQEILAVVRVDQPVEPVLCLLLKILRYRVVNEEVLGTAADKLLVGAVVRVLRNRHHTHVLTVVICVDDGPVPVSAEHECDLAFRQLLLCCLTLCSDRRILCVVVLHQNIEGIHQRVELLILRQVDRSVVKALDKRGRILALLIDLLQIVSCKRPVFLHDAGRSLHAAVNQLLAECIEIIQRLDRSRIKILTGDLLDRICVVDDAARLDAYREAHYLAVDADDLAGILHPRLIGQVKCVIRPEAVDILCVDHGQNVRILGGILGGKMRCHCILRVVDFHIDIVLI